MMPRLRQALIEFENMEDAINCVQACQVQCTPYIIKRVIFAHCQRTFVTLVLT